MKTIETFEQPGDVVTLVAPYDVTGGDGLLVGIIFGIAAYQVASGTPVETCTTGVFRINALSTDVGAQGAAVYWDNTNRRVTTSSSGNTAIGALVVAKQSGSAVAVVRVVSRVGTVGLSYLIGKQHTAQSKSDLDALESAALFTLDIPANTLGPNSSLRVRTLWTTPTSAATKRLRGRFGGTVLWNLDLTTHVSYPLEFILSNRNSLASQVAQANNLSWAVALASSAVQTFTVDFATAQQFTITAQWPVAGAGSNNITLESVMVEHLYGA